MFHPWGILRQLAHISLHRVLMPDLVPGRTNGVDEIWMDKRLLQVERRCTLTHELIHIERAHTSHQPEKIERQVCAETARRLITLEDLCQQLAWARSGPELADELWVTPEVLMDRITSLNADELAQLAAVELQQH